MIPVPSLSHNSNYPMSNTSLIPRPANQPDVHVLEVDGPRGRFDVNYSPGMFGPTLTFEQWKDLPEHVRNVVNRPDETDFNSACRLLNLFDACVDAKQMSVRHAQEIRWRIALLHPGPAEHVKFCNA